MFFRKDKNMAKEKKIKEPQATEAQPESVKIGIAESEKLQKEGWTVVAVKKNSEGNIYTLERGKK